MQGLTLHITESPADVQGEGRSDLPLQQRVPPIITLAPARNSCLVVFLFRQRASELVRELLQLHSLGRLWFREVKPISCFDTATFIIDLGSMQDCRRLARANVKAALVLEEHSRREAPLHPKPGCLVSGVLALPQVRTK